jgi:NTP pyrophosphatase (non-canonical NTP hydrolase)
MEFKKLQKYCHKIAIEHGWWIESNPNHIIPEKLLLMHTEISEAVEEYREHLFDFTEIEGKPLGFPIELADLVIRVLDLCGAYDIDLEKMILMKMKYNKTRPYRHGNKKI